MQLEVGPWTEFFDHDKSHGDSYFFDFPQILCQCSHSLKCFSLLLYLDTALFFSLGFKLLKRKTHFIHRQSVLDSHMLKVLGKWRDWQELNTVDRASL